METKHKAIFEEIKQEQIDFYRFIQTEFNKSEGNIKDKVLFQNLFKLYYNLGHYLGKKFFKFYFSKFSNKDLQETIKKLKNVDGLRSVLENLLEESKKATGKYHYSFISKIIHTINPEFPIYDKYIRIALKLRDPSGDKEEKRCEIFWETYKEIWDCYRYILKNKCLDKIIEEFSVKRDITELSKVKILDFLFWSMGKVMEK